MPMKTMMPATTHEGVQGLARLPVFADIDFVFDATSAGAHVKNDAFLRSLKPAIRMIDLTPAAIGPYCIPVVNGAPVHIIAFERIPAAGIAAAVKFTIRG